MINYIAIFIGGGLGSLARYGMHRWLGFSESGFPLGTLAANFAACILLGFFGGLLLEKVDLPNYIRGGAMIGFCGGFSTFSTFSNEGFGLLGSDRPGLGLLYIGTSIVLCLGGIWLGQLLGRSMA
ncbi:MAG TPA: CrcB family protein [Bacteroidetes bacterium]|nr:CrcB family protein [Bacteroidota bacterium]